jgi:hypothetical protein
MGSLGTFQFRLDSTEVRCVVQSLKIPFAGAMHRPGTIATKSLTADFTDWFAVVQRKPITDEFVAGGTVNHAHRGHFPFVCA